MKDKNKEDRLWFVEFWVDYMKTHKDWDRQQKLLINSQLKNRLKDKNLYLKIKGELPSK